MAAVAHSWLHQGSQWICLMHGETQAVNAPAGLFPAATLFPAADLVPRG